MEVSPVGIDGLYAPKFTTAKSWSPGISHGWVTGVVALLRGLTLVEVGWSSGPEGDGRCVLTAGISHRRAADVVAVPRGLTPVEVKWPSDPQGEAAAVPLLHFYSHFLRS